MGPSAVCILFLILVLCLSRHVVLRSAAAPSHSIPIWRSRSLFMTVCVDADLGSTRAASMLTSGQSEMIGFGENGPNNQ